MELHINHFQEQKVSSEMTALKKEFPKNLSSFALRSTTFLPADTTDRARIYNAFMIVHYADSETQYRELVNRYMDEAKKISLSPNVCPLLEAAIAQDSYYFSQKKEDAYRNNGTTIFPIGGDCATSIILRIPEKNDYSILKFLNTYSEEMIHAFAQQAKFLTTVQEKNLVSGISPLDLFELVGRLIKHDFFEQCYPSLLSRGEELYWSKIEKEFDEADLDRESLKNLYFRGRYEKNETGKRRLIDDSVTMGE